MAAPTDVFYRPPGAQRPPTRARGRARPRWLTRTLNAAIIMLIVAVVGTGVGYVYLRMQLAKIKRLDIPSLADDLQGGVMNVLLVGSDSRSNVGADLADATGKAQEGDRSGLSDTMMILHIDPKQGQAAILSIPRDLYITIAGNKGRDRINVAFAEGGPQKLIATIQQSLGIQINHYAEVDFQGFKNIVDTVGGLNVYFDAAARDTVTGLDVPTPGCVRLDGFQSLAYVRSRYYETYEAGRWVTDESSDFGRIKRQQDFIRRMMKKAVSQGLTNPLTLNRLVNIGVNNLTLDSGMSTKDIVTVARRFKSLDPESVDMQTLPTTRYITPAGADVQLLDEAAAGPLIDRINGKAPLQTTVRPSDVQVRVLNGNGGDAAASRAGVALRGVGFEVTGTADADSFDYDATLIRYGPAALAKAQLVQSYLIGKSTLKEDATLGTADVAVVLGASYAGVRPSPAGPEVNPTTTTPAQNPQPDARGSKQPAC